MQPTAAGAEAEMQSTMPMPPAYYYKKYSDVAVAAGTVPGPPEPLIDDYFMFGQKYCHNDEVIRPLEEQGLPRLYPEHADKKKELKKLVISLLCSFLDLLHILVESPSSPDREEKLDDMNILFINIHHVLNKFRPHQARETLKVMMEMQKKEISEAIAKLTEGRNEANEIITKCREEVKQMKQEYMQEDPDVKVETSITSSAPSSVTSSDAAVVKIEQMDIDELCHPEGSGSHQRRDDDDDDDDDDEFYSHLPPTNLFTNNSDDIMDSIVANLSDWVRRIIIIIGKEIIVVH